MELSFEDVILKPKKGDNTFILFKGRPIELFKPYRPIKPKMER